MSSTGKIHFACRVARFKSAFSCNTGKTTGHTANCSDCQAYFRANDALVSALRRDATQKTQPATPEDLAARIALAVRQSTPRQRRSRTAGWSTLAGATAVVAFSVFIVRQNLPTQPSNLNSQTVEELRPADVAKLVANVDSLRIRFLNSVEPAAAKIATQNPLTQELSSVQADARSALGFLALNFLPTDANRQIGPTADPTRS